VVSFKPSIVASALLHLGVLGLAVFGLPSAERLEAPPPETLPVDLVPLAEFNKLQQGDKKADKDKPPAPKKVEKPKEVKVEPAPAPKPKPVEATPPPKPAEPAPPKVEPKPAEPAPPKVEPEPKPDPEPAEPALPEFKPVAAPPRKPKPTPPQTVQTPSPPQTQPSNFDADRVAALLNKLPDAGAPQAPNDLAQTTSGFGLDRGTDDSLSMDEISFLRSQISRCWSPPVGVASAAELTVDIYFQLNVDGTVNGSPRVTRAPSSQIGQIAAESARRAIELCQPYILPPQKYDLWREIELTFDPSFMLGR